MFTDAITSVKAYLYDRAVSPLMGSFIVSWIIWNFKFLLVLIAPISVYEKLWLFENAFFHNYFSILGYNLFFPILTSIVYLFIFPIPSRFVYKYWLNQQNILKNLKNELKLGRVLTVEDSRFILSRLNNERADLESENLSLKNDHKKAIDENNSLKNEIQKVNLVNKNFASRVTNFSGLYTTLDDKLDRTAKNIFLNFILEKLSDLQLIILTELYNFKELNFHQLNTKYKYEDLDVQSEIKALENLGLCSEKTIFNRGITLTAFGKQLISHYKDEKI